MEQPMTEVVERQKDVGITSLLPPKQVLGVYIQVPFCQTKCTYCNFHTGVASPAAYAPYASAVEREIRNWRALHAAAGLESAAHFDRIEQPITGVVERQKRVRNHAAFGDTRVDTIYLGGGTPS